MAETVAREPGFGGELVLRRDGEDFELVCNGTFLMDTRDGRSERLLVREAVQTLRADDGRPLSLLLGGLGVGFSLDEAVAEPIVNRVVVVEREPVLLSWHETHLATRSGAAMADPRVTVVCADVVEWLGICGERFDVVCLDVDNGPGWVVDEGNAALYQDSGLASVERVLAPGGVIAVWSAHESPDFARRLRSRFGDVRAVRVPVSRGEPDVVYLARRR